MRRPEGGTTAGIDRHGLRADLLARGIVGGPDAGSRGARVQDGQEGGVGAATRLRDPRRSTRFYSPAPRLGVTWVFHHLSRPRNSTVADRCRFPYSRAASHYNLTPIADNLFSSPGCLIDPL
ncbi:MAG TPA: hypothetical protein VED37_17470 [Ktedonobacteraceae bacterium]|nr:hypothetical protein [Ktedonobacteraceae bacterium]